MLTLQVIKENPEFVIERLAVKGFDGKEVINKIIEVDAERRRLQTLCDTEASQLKKLSASIGQLMKEGKKEEAESVKQEVARIKADTKSAQDKLAEDEKLLTDLLLTVVFRINGRAFLSLLSHLYQYFNRGFVCKDSTGSLGCLCFKKFLLDTS